MSETMMMQATVLAFVPSPVALQEMLIWAKESFRTSRMFGEKQEAFWKARVELLKGLL